MNEYETPEVGQLSGVAARDLWAYQNTWLAFETAVAAAVAGVLNIVAFQIDLSIALR